MQAQDLILVVIAALVLYVLWQLWRVRRLARAASPPVTSPAPAPEPPSPAIKPPETPDPLSARAPKAALSAGLSVPSAAAPVRPDADPGDDDDSFSYAPLPRGPSARTGAAGGAGAGGFGDTLSQQTFRRDALARFETLEAQIDAQARQIETLSAEVERLGQQVSSGLVADLPPEYDEAVVLARRGLPVAQIAERCGISVAEAQLVMSMTPTADREGGAHGD